MKSLPVARLTALAMLLSVLHPFAAPAQGVNDTEALRKRISAEIKAGLPQTVAAPAMRALTSRPEVLTEPRPGAGASTASPAEFATAPADSTPDGIWNDLVAGNRRFVADHPRSRPYTRERLELAGGQHPRAVILGCADSRVSPELVFDQTLGDVFVVRTAGNIVDPIALGSIEYAVEHLHSRLLVVLGHTACGAVTAAAGGEAMPSSYLQAIVDRIRPTVERLSNCFEGDELVERSVVANARQSAADILSNSAIVRDAVARGELKVMSAVYDLHGGLVTPVSVPAATAAAQAPGH